MGELWEYLCHERQKKKKELVSGNTSNQHMLFVIKDGRQPACWLAMVMLIEDGRGKEYDISMTAGEHYAYSRQQTTYIENITDINIEVQTESINEWMNLIY